MKKLKTLMIVVLLVVMLLYGTKLINAVSNDKRIVYDGKTKQFTSYNINTNDLFSNFKELMPGDTKQETLVFKSKNINRHTKLYAKFTSIVNLTSDLVKFRIYVNDNKIHDDYLYKDINKSINLTKFSKNNESKIKFEVYVPTSATNEIMDVKTDAKLEFIIEEGDKVILPKTYDDSNIILNVIVFTISLILIIIILFKKKKEQIAK